MQPISPYQYLPLPRNPAEEARYDAVYKAGTAVYYANQAADKTATYEIIRAVKDVKNQTQTQALLGIARNTLLSVCKDCSQEKLTYWKVLDVLEHFNQARQAGKLATEWGLAEATIKRLISLVDRQSPTTANTSNGSLSLNATSSTTTSSQREQNQGTGAAAALTSAASITTLPTQHQ